MTTCKHLILSSLLIIFPNYIKAVKSFMPTKRSELSKELKVVDEPIFEIPARDIVKTKQKIGTFMLIQGRSLFIQQPTEELSAAYFKNISGVNEAFMDDSVIQICEECFSYCRDLIKVKLSGKLTYLPEKCFYGCQKLSYIEIPYSVLVVGKRCFSACTNLTVVMLQNHIVGLDRKCFSKCTSLKEISLPASLKAIGERCFSGCTALARMHITQKLWERIPGSTDREKREYLGLDNSVEICLYLRTSQ